MDFWPFFTVLRIHYIVPHLFLCQTNPRYLFLPVLLFVHVSRVELSQITCRPVVWLPPDVFCTCKDSLLRAHILSIFLYKLIKAVGYGKRVGSGGHSFLRKGQHHSFPTRLLRICRDWRSKSNIFLELIGSSWNFYKTWTRIEGFKQEASLPATIFSTFFLFLIDSFL